MKIIWVTALLLAAIPCFAQTTNANNDFFAQRSLLVGESISTSGSTFGASAETGEPAHAGLPAENSRWWTWEAPLNGMARLAVSNAGTFNYQRAAVYTGNQLAVLVPIAAGGGRSNCVVAFPATAGQTYQIAVDSLDSFVDFFQLSLGLESIQLAEPLAGTIVPVGQPIRLALTNHTPSLMLSNVEFFVGTQFVAAASAPPFACSWLPTLPGVYTLSARATDNLGVVRRTAEISVKVLAAFTNDNFEAAAPLIALADGTYTGSSDTTLATHQLGEPVHRDATDHGSVWFKWVAAWTGPSGFCVLGSEANMFCRVYTGSALGNLALVSSPSGAPVRVVGGQDYFIAVDGPTGGAVKVMVYPPAANDDFANATLTGGASGTLAGSNLSATVEPGEPGLISGADASLWWKWTAPADGTLTLDTIASGNMVVETTVYEGTLLAELNPVFGPLVTSASSTTYGILSNQTASVTVSAGTTYSLRLNGADLKTYPSRGTNGLLQAQYTFTPTVVAAANDAFDQSIPLTGYANEVAGSTILSTMETGEPQPWPLAPSGSVWWSYAAPQKGVLRVSTGLPVAVYRGATLGSLELAGRSSDAAVVVNVEKGERVLIAAYRYPSDAETFTLHTLLQFPLVNDAFADRIKLSGTNCSFAADNTLATLEAGEQKPSTNTVGHTIWYSWTAPFVGRLTFAATWPPSGRGQVGVYIGESLAELRLVRKVEHGSILLTEAGTTYHFQVDTEVPGVIEAGFSLAPLLPPTNDLFGNAINLLHPFPVSLEGASLEAGEPYYAPGLDRSLWWLLPAGISGAITATTDGSLATNVVLYLYRGDRLEDLVLVGMGTNRIKYPVVGGVNYYIAATAPAGAIGDVVVSYGVSENTAAVIVENIMCDSSLETAITNTGCWKAQGGGWYVHETLREAADGKCHVELAPDTLAWQDVATVPGRLYQLRFAYGGDWAPLRVLADNQVVGELQTPPPGTWYWTNFTFIALSSLTELKFQTLGKTVFLDGMSLVWAQEPPSFIQQPVSRAAYAGYDAILEATIRGTFPLRGQWYFQNTPLPGKTAPVLLLPRTTINQAGPYYLVVTNAFGAITSAVVNLSVEAFEQPTIVLQPYGDTVECGTYFALSVVAQGLQPTSYQWYLNNQPLLAATNRHVIFDSFTASNAGDYKVAVSNAAGLAWSLSARLVSAPPATGGCMFFVNNHMLNEVEAPIFDVDGSRLSGSNFVAQLYGGPSLERMRPTGTPIPFRSGSAAGYFYATILTLANVVPDGFAFVQVRVWDRQRAASYEEARAVGAKFGRSGILYLEGGGLFNTPQYLKGMKSFTLSAGLPEFVAGRLALTGQTNGVLTWSLAGHGGYRYLIERALTGFAWEPFLVLTNETGSVSFQAPITRNQNFFRARILE